MKIKKVISRFAKACESEVELRRVARALANELPRQRLDALRSFRAEMARIAVPVKSYAAGYVAGMLDVTVEYEISVQQASENEALMQIARREGFREVLLELRDGPKLPSELASRLHRDRASITRTLDRLRELGLIRAYADGTGDRRTRPHRLTIEGVRVADELSAGLSPEVARGISIAVSLFHHLMTHASSPASALDAIVSAKLGNPESAAEAVRVWAEEAKEAGLIKEAGLVTELGDAGAHEGQQVVEAESGASTSRNKVLWENMSYVIKQLNEKEQSSMPVYVRTSKADWGAWAYALRKSDMTGRARTIVNGDILSRAVAPPTDERFALVYDDPRTVSADRREPTMQAFLQNADAKFVVASAEETVPEGFIQLKLSPDDTLPNRGVR